MRELTFPVENPQIKINGIVFDLQLSDLEIYERAQGLFPQLTKYENLPIDQIKTDEIMADVASAVDFLDEILGAGAVRKISHGRPVRLSLALKWIAKIAEDAASHYAELVDSVE